MNNISRILIFCLFTFFMNESMLAKGILTIRLEPVFRGKPLILSEKTYVTSNGESLTIEEFKYYISNLQLSGKQSQYIVKNSAYLINAAEPQSLLIQLKNIPDGKYNALTFNIGLDSLTNVSGALGGDLDPTLGMYWAWNTGYINAKLTGHSNSCPTLHNKFEFHIGGYAEPYITLRKVQLPMDEIELSDKNHATITLQVEISKWFEGIHLVSMNNIVTPSKEAMRMADNYMTMFQVIKPEGNDK